MQISAFTPIERVVAHSGLVVDADTWAIAHGYHDAHQRLHALAWHGAGIRWGLSVVANGTADDTVVVEPGVAVDSEGRAILVESFMRVPLPAEGTPAYVLLEYVERPLGSNGGRVAEDYRIRVTTEPPDRSQLELARVARSPEQQAPIRAAAQWWDPADDEIDERFRSVAAGGATRELTIAYVSVGSPEGPSADHLEGFFYLVRELRRVGISTSPVVTEPGSSHDLADLYYLAAAAGPPSDRDREFCAEIVRSGARLLIDGCRGADAFVADFLDAPPTAGAGEDHERAILRARHVLAEPPAGSFPKGRFSWHPLGAVTGRDIGCAWAGSAAATAEVRDALEFGVNMSTWASQPLGSGTSGRPPA